MREREIISRIFFSSFVSTKGRVFSVVPRLLDERVFSVRGMFRRLVEVDRAKLVRVLFGFWFLLLLLL